MAATIKIAEMLEKTNIDDNNFIIVEDDIDTKRATVKELKRAFIGDGVNPDTYKFYSSQKVIELINNIKINISALPSRQEFDYLAQQIKNIVGSVGEGKDSELVAARGEYDTLSERLIEDQLSLEKKYIQFPKIDYSGMQIDLSELENVGVTIICPSYENDTTLKIIGKNRYSYEDTGYSQITKVNDHGLKIVYTKTQNAFNIPIGQNLPAGEYALYASASFSDNYIKEGTVLKIIYTDDSVSQVPYKYSSLVKFNTIKTFKAFQILPNISTIVDGMWLQLDDIMISNDVYLDRFYECCDATYDIPAHHTVTKDINLTRCILNRSESTIKVTVTDTSFTGNKIKDELNELKSYTTQPEDHCGLLENKGTYIYTSKKTISDSPEVCVISEDSSKKRNHKNSIKITMMNYDPENQPKFTITLENILNLTDSKYISFQFYIDKDLSERFSEDDGIKIMLSSDIVKANPSSNYYYFNIGKNSFIQGWNTIKLKISDFLIHGNPKIGNITQINFRIFSSEFTNGKSFWLNSIIIDQRMKPVVLFAFDNLYEDAFDYTFPYMYTRGIPATIFANDKQTHTKEYLNNVAMLHYKYGWEIANYGCNPNKEIMIEDDNPRDQYISVKETRQWIYDNFTSKVISYAAPFGNLRAISEPILKELGFKIAKTTADAYCSLFTKNDFCIPMHLLSNALNCGSDQINKKIDEIVETGQCLCIYTDQVTRYGDDISATKTSFESVISHIQNYVNDGLLEIMTFSEFYNKCVSR